MIQFLVVHARSNAEYADCEFAAIVKASGQPANRFTRVNILYHPIDVTRVKLFDGIIICGSPYSVDAPELVHRDTLSVALTRALSAQIPTLGICFGAQFIAKHYGGTVVKNGGCAEHGTTAVSVSTRATRDPTFLRGGIPSHFFVQQSHFDHIETLPKGALLLATNKACAVQAYSMRAGRILGLQFHPERDPEWMRERFTVRAQTEPYIAERLPAILESLRDSTIAHGLIKRFVDGMILKT